MEARKKVFGNDKSKTSFREFQTESDPKTSASLSEGFIFKLSGTLGGRDEVVKGKAHEILKYFDMTMEKQEQEAEEEQTKMWVNYLSMIYSNQSNDKKFNKAKDDFAKSLKPQDRKEIEGGAKVYDWDFEVLKRLQREQGGG